MAIQSEKLATSLKVLSSLVEKSGQFIQLPFITSLSIIVYK